MKTLNHLDEQQRYWLEKALRWADERWNEEYSLIEMPLDRKKYEEIKKRYQGYEGIQEHYYGVRDSVWYATGLLMRQGEDDIKRALTTIAAILTYQFDEPEAIYHGTFLRYPGEPHPRNNTIIWRGYDPNWREFICTVFILQLTEFASLLPDDLQEKMRHAIKLAAEGAFMRKVAPEYTNISLMSAFLLDYAGRHFDNAVWVDYALEQAHLIHELFNRNKTFNEYNSPTYYGVDLYALALWREYGAAEVYRSLGAEMEAELWRDTAQFYHAGMRNICGPYDRSYGMDMTNYLASVGLWIAAVLPPERAPLPDVDQQFDHAGDYYFMPMVALMGSQPPADVLPHLGSFQGERFLQRIIEPNRTVSAWLSDDLMLGAESDNVNDERTDQFHAATAHWTTLEGIIGWLRTRCETLIQAAVKPKEIQFTSKQPVEHVFEIRVPGANREMIQADQWTLPGCTIQFQGVPIPLHVSQDEDILTVSFESDEPITLSFSQ